MNNCASSCGEVPFKVLSPITNCKIETRDRFITRLVFKPCDIDLPDQETNIGMKTLFDNGHLAFTSLLANVALEDPSTDDYDTADELPLDSTVTGRVFTAQDKIKRENSTLSPAVLAKYEDFVFWQNKIDQKYNMNVGMVYNTGDVVWARDAKGVFLRATILTWLNYEKITSGSTKRFVEYKSIRIVFEGDPLALYNVPTWNYITAGISL